MVKWIIAFILVVWVTVGISRAVLIDNVVTWMYDSGFTVFDSTDHYQPSNAIRRDEAAKFFVTFAESINKTNYVVSADQCVFSDLDQGHADLVDIMVRACRYGIFLWHNQKFMPTQLLTNEQAVVVLVRILYGKQSELQLSRWSDNYYQKAYKYGLLRNVSMSDRWANATRGDIAISLYDASGNNTNNTFVSRNIKRWVNRRDTYLYSNVLNYKNWSIGLLLGAWHDSHTINFVYEIAWKRYKLDGLNPSWLSFTYFDENWSSMSGQVRLTAHNNGETEFTIKKFWPGDSQTSSMIEVVFDIMVWNENNIFVSKALENFKWSIDANQLSILGESFVSYDDADLP